MSSPEPLAMPPTEPPIRHCHDPLAPVLSYMRAAFQLRYHISEEPEECLTEAWHDWRTEYRELEARMTPLSMISRRI